jgi:hypothetical protein
MDTTNRHTSTGSAHLTPEEAGVDLASAGGDALRIAEIGVVVFLGLLVCPPLLILAVIVAAPLLAIAAVFAAIFGAIAVPTLLVRSVRAHHRAHGTTMFLHHLPWARRRGGALEG